MNEKLKEAFEAWRKGKTPDENERSTIYPYIALPVLEAAAKGEFPGFQLVPVEPTEKMTEAWAGLVVSRLRNPEGNKGLLPSIKENYAAMLTAYKEEQT